MVQKILKIGSSAGIIIPKKTLEEFGLKVGSRVDFNVDKGRKIIKLEPEIKIDKELFEWTKKFIKKYRPALEALAKN